MADEQENVEPAEDVQEPVGRFDILGQLSAMTGISRSNVTVGLGFTAMSVATIAAWLAMANAVTQPVTATIELALRALDEGEDELARATVNQMQEQTTLTVGEYGGPLFVLGALKVREAERHFSQERRRSDYFIASRYLNEARVIGFPEGREIEGLLLLGKSLLESRQLKSGIRVLQDAMASGARGDARLHTLLAEAYFYSPKPRYEECLQQIEDALVDDSMSPAKRNDVLLLRSKALANLLRADEAYETAYQATAPSDPAARELVLGQAWLTKLRTSLNKSEPLSEDIRQLAEKAFGHFAEAKRLDKLATPISTGSEYLEACTHELLGDHEAALAVYAELRRDYGVAPAGIAAAIAEGDLQMSQDKYKAAVDSYRRALAAVEDPSVYQSDLMSLQEMKMRIEAAHRGLIAKQHFTSALILVDHLTPLFSYKNQLEFRAKTLEIWGDSLIEQSESILHKRNVLVARGRRRLRESGMAYEELAQLRFATPYFIDDLWRAAEVYRRGQSYSSTIKLLERYLRHEPLQRNAQALLKLGQAYLSQNKPEKAIDVFEECLEFHTTDVASYPARLGCAKAYRLLGQQNEAEQLLLDNLRRTAMTPASPEWRDSLFELGRLQMDTKRYDEAILTFDEAVRRYPNAALTRQAYYLMGEAHRQAAAEPLARLIKAKTVNEREKYGTLARNHLEQALAKYELVQREITLLDATIEPERLMLRNCYMLRGAVLFRLGRYEEAIKSYSSVSTLYQNEPFVLETLVQISHCWRRLKDSVKARGAIEQAKLLLARLPDNADFATSTNLNRTEWEQLLADLYQF